MKARFYLKMVKGGLEEIQYEEARRVRTTHRYYSHECEVHVSGYFKYSGLDYHRLGYLVMLFVQSKGLSPGKLYHE